MKWKECNLTSPCHPIFFLLTLLFRFFFFLSFWIFMPFRVLFRFWSKLFLSQPPPKSYLLPAGSTPSCGCSKVWHIILVCFANENLYRLFFVGSPAEFCFSPAVGINWPLPGRLWTKIKNTNHWPQGVSVCLPTQQLSGTGHNAVQVYLNQAAFELRVHGTEREKEEFLRRRNTHTDRSVWLFFPRRVWKQQP